MNRLAPAIAILFVWLIVQNIDIYRNELELWSYNLRQSAFPAELSDQIVIGGIDEKSKEYFGPFPWDRAIYGLLTQDLAERGAEAVFLDLIFDVEKPGDEQVGQSLRTLYSIVAGTVEDGAEAYLLPTVSPPIADTADIGVINKSEDSDEVIRFSWLAIAVNHSTWPESPLLCPALLAYLHEKGQDADDVSFFVNGLPLSAVLPNVREFPLNQCPGRIISGEVSIPVQVSINSNNDAIFFLLPIRYGVPQTPGPGPGVVSFVELPETDVSKKYIFVGENTQTDTDVVKAPTGRMKGVEAHAHAFNALLTDNYLRQIGHPGVLYLLVGLVTLAGLNRSHKGRSIVLRCATLCTLYFALNLMAFNQGYWLPLAMPLIQIVLSGGMLMVLRSEVARRTFASLTTKEAAREMLISDTGDALEATTVNATIIVSDIRGYTTLSETRTPVQMIELLNQYHTETVKIYERYGGRALTYQGDAQLIVFGYPNKLKNPAKASVQAAVGLQEAVIKLRELWGVSDDTFSVGAACCTGSVAIGRLGAIGQQIQYTVIGDPVRRAHKIQSMSDELDSPVLMDPETAVQIGSALDLESLGVVDVPGLDKPLELTRPKPETGD